MTITFNHTARVGTAEDRSQAEDILTQTLEVLMPSEALTGRTINIKMTRNRSDSFGARVGWSLKPDWQNRRYVTNSDQAGEVTLNILEPLWPSYLVHEAVHLAQYWLGIATAQKCLKTGKASVLWDHEAGLNFAISAFNGSPFVAGSGNTTEYRRNRSEYHNYPWEKQAFRMTPHLCHKIGLDKVSIEAAHRFKQLHGLASNGAFKAWTVKKISEVREVWTVVHI